MHSYSAYTWSIILYEEQQELYAYLKDIVLQFLN